MNPDDQRSKREQLEQAIAAQEGLRGLLDDVIIEATIAALRKQLVEMERTPEVEQQRKLATVLFMDVVNSTRLMAVLDPEVHLSIMDQALQRLSEPVNDHGGRVIKFMGDGYLAIFGLPRARENDPEMAVRAGLGVVTTAGIIAREIEAEHRLEGFQVRVGINTGLIVAGGVTEAEETIMGAAVNLAARLESAAPPGGVLISQHTYQHVRGIFNLEAGQAIQAKGFEQPVQVYLVKSAKPRTFRTSTRGVEGVETSLVGRQLEMNTLQQTCDLVLQKGESRFITIVGEAGLGKSRLLEEFERWLERRSDIQAILLKGRATSETRNLPYALFRDLIAYRFDIRDDDPANLARQKIVDGFKSAPGTAGDLEIGAHFVGQLLGFDFSDSHYLEGVLDAPRQFHDRALVYLRNYLKALATENPLAFFLDDIHWADESSLDTLVHLSEELTGHQIMFIALARPSLYQRRASWGQETQHLRIDLQPLSTEDSQFLVGEVLQKLPDIPAKLRDLIVHTAEGNPFYLEELIKMLVEDGVIVKAEPVWYVHPERLVEVRIPPTLTGVVQARLDGLPKEEHTVIQQASVIGRVFWEATVDYISREIASTHESGSSMAVALPSILDQLQAREMVFRNETSAFSDSVEYIFKHNILREVTYESVLIRTRRKYHGMVADWLIAHSGGRVEEIPTLIAEHLENAGRVEEALDFLCHAAEAATHNYAVGEAAEFYTRAFALAPVDDLDRRYTILLGRELVSSMQGDRIAQREALQGLSEIVETLGDNHKRAAVLIRKAWYGYWTGEYLEALKAARQAVNLAESAKEQELLRQADYVLAWLYLLQGEYDRALVPAQEALPLARQSGNRRDEGNLYNILGMINIAQGDYHAASVNLNAFLNLARQIDDREREMTALNNLGVVMTILGSYEAAQSDFHQHLSAALEMGDKVSKGTSFINLAWISSAMGEWDMTIKYAEQGLSIKREQEQIEAVAEGLIWLGHAWVGLDQPENAIPAYQESLAIRRELDQPHLAVEVMAGLARAELIQSNLTGKDTSRASGHVAEIIAYLDAGGSLHGTWEPLRIYWTCYQVLKQSNNVRAGEFLEKAYSILQEHAARIPGGEDRQRFLEAVPWHREIVAEQDKLQN